MSLFGEQERKPAKAKEMFCGKWTLREAMGKLLDIKFQDTKNFFRLLAELYAHAITSESKELLSFLESRFNRNLIQDKEVHLHFQIVSSREEAGDPAP